MTCRREEEFNVKQVNEQCVLSDELKCCSEELCVRHPVDEPCYEHYRAYTEERHYVFVCSSDDAGAEWYLIYIEA